MSARTPQEARGHLRTTAAPVPDDGSDRRSRTARRYRAAFTGVLAACLTGGLAAAPALAFDGSPAAGSGDLEIAVYSALGAGAGSITVNWDDAAETPGRAEVTGYTVRALSRDGVYDIRKRLFNTAATQESTTLTGLVPNDVYSIEIVARSAEGDGPPSVISSVKAASHIVPSATATTLRRSTDGKFAPLVTGVNGDFGVHLDPIPGLTPTAEIHYTTDGSIPSLQSRTFVPGVSPSIQIRQDTTVRWVVRDSGNVVGPQGARFFDIIESPNPPPQISSVAAAPVSGAAEVTWSTLPADGERPVTGYRLQAYTGASVDVATGVRVGDPVVVAQPADPAATEVVRRMVGLTNGREYRFTVAARYGTLFSDESALSAPVTPTAAAGVNAGPDQLVPRGTTVTLDGSASQRVTSYRWTQVRPRITNSDGTTYQDPPVQLIDATTARPTFHFPTKSSAQSDDNTFQFRLTTTHSNADGTTFTRWDLVDVTQQPDAVATTETTWRAGETLSGTGTQEQSRLSFHSGSPVGAVVATAIVTGGVWSVAATNAQPTGGRLYVWSDHGYVGEISLTP